MELPPELRAIEDDVNNELAALESSRIGDTCSTPPEMMEDTSSAELDAFQTYLISLRSAVETSGEAEFGRNPDGLE